jgi:hypothetical protein
MEQVTIGFDDRARNGFCAICRERSRASAGLRLLHGESFDIVCRNCGQARAPQLLALVDLARAAERVGKVCRYLLVPPMESLLDLARAAEEYSNNAPKALGRAA